MSDDTFNTVEEFLTLLRSVYNLRVGGGGEDPVDSNGNFRCKIQEAVYTWFLVNMKKINHLRPHFENMVNNLTSLQKYEFVRMLSMFTASIIIEQDGGNTKRARMFLKSIR